MNRAEISAGREHRGVEIPFELELQITSPLTRLSLPVSRQPESGIRKEDQVKGASARTGKGESPVRDDSTRERTAFNQKDCFFLCADPSRRVWSIGTRGTTI